MFKLNPFKKEKKPALVKTSTDAKALDKSEDRPAKKAKARPASEAKTEKKASDLGEALKATGRYPLGILIAPRITEKATLLLESANQYVFEVSDKANAYRIKDAVQKKYGVKVKKVNVLNQPGKKIRLGRREGWRKGFRKAVVTLEKGQSIEFA